MDSIRLKARAKINLGLDVLGKRENGYHDVKMVMQTKNSKTGFVKIALNFCVSQELLTEVQNRFYPTDRFRALIENYFDEYKGRMAELMQS